MGLFQVDNPFSASADTSTMTGSSTTPATTTSTSTQAPSTYSTLPDPSTTGGTLSAGLTGRAAGKTAKERYVKPAYSPSENWSSFMKSIGFTMPTAASGERIMHNGDPKDPNYWLSMAATQDNRIMQNAGKAEQIAWRLQNYGLAKDAKLGDIADILGTKRKDLQQNPGVFGALNLNQLGKIDFNPAWGRSAPTADTTINGVNGWSSMNRTSGRNGTPKFMTEAVNERDIRQLMRFMSGDHGALADNKKAQDYRQLGTMLQNDPVTALQSDLWKRYYTPSVV